MDSNMENNTENSVDTSAQCGAQITLGEMRNAHELTPETLEQVQTFTLQPTTPGQCATGGNADCGLAQATGQSQGCTPRRVVPEWTPRFRPMGDLNGVAGTNPSPTPDGLADEPMCTMHAVFSVPVTYPTKGVCYLTFLGIPYDEADLPAFRQAVATFEAAAKASGVSVICSEPSE